MHPAVRKHAAVSGHVKVSRSYLSAVRGAGFAGILSASVFALGCGNAYRPVVASISPVGPASQPQKYAVAVANNGLMTIIDFAGDTIMSTAQTSANPSYFAIGVSGDGYVLHCKPYDPALPGTPCSGLIDGVSISDRLRTQDVVQATLSTSATPATLTAGANYIYVTQPGRSSVAVLNANGNAGLGPTANTEIPVAANPVYVVNRQGATRVFALSQGNTLTGNGVATPIQVSTNTSLTPVTVGVNPVYGVLNPDTRRAFVVNKGSGTVSVINTQTGVLDTNSSFTGTIPVGDSPVWAETADNLNELLVLNQGSGGAAGTLSLINIPLCNPIATGSSTCDANNPTDAVGFGQVVKTIPVGINPFMVTVLQDQNKAYVSNQGNSTVGSQTISVIDLNTMLKIKDIPITGTPTWIAATGGTPTGKVYVLCKDTDRVTVIYTDTDTAQTQTLNIGGLGVSLRVTAQ